MVCIAFHPIRRYYVEVFAARPLSPSGFEAGTVSTRAGPAALGAPSAATAAPAVTQVTSGASPAVSIEVRRVTGRLLCTALHLAPNCAQ